MNWKFSLFGLLLISSASAQTPSTGATTTPEKVLGWQKNSNLGVNLSFASSTDVIGQTDGNSETYGLNLKSGFYNVRERFEWRTDGLLSGATTRTPNVPRYIKSADELKIGTAYLHFWNGNPDFGPYVRAEASAPMFRGENVQSTAKAYRINYRNRPSEVITGTSIRLTDGFKPLTTKESAGVFWRPRNDDRLKIETRLGVAALQVAADGQFSVGGTNAAGELSVNELTDINQVGVEASVAVKGKIDDKSAYEAGLELLTPFVNNQDSADDRDPINLTNVDGFVKLTSNITSWASFGYDYKVKLQPQLVERAQQTHMLVLNANYNLF